MSLFLDNSSRTRITSDYLWNKTNDEVIDSLVLSGFPKLPTKTEIKKYDSWQKNSYKENSVFRDVKFMDGHLVSI